MSTSVTESVLENHPLEGTMTLSNWLSRLSPGSRARAKGIFEKWMAWMAENGEEFADMSPDDLVNYQRMAPYNDRYKILDKVQRYISDMKPVVGVHPASGVKLNIVQRHDIEFRVASKKGYYAAILSFFNHNRAELPSDSSFNIWSEIPPVEGTLTVEDIRKVIMRSNSTYHAIFLAMLQSGMDISSFEFWNLNGWDSLKKELEKDPKVITIWLPGRKKRRNKMPFQTFIGPDSVEAIKTYLPQREGAREAFERSEKGRRNRAQRKGEPYVEREFKTAIFYTKFGEPIDCKALQKYWMRQTIRLGMVKRLKNGYRGNRYEKNLHELRDVFRSQWEKSPAKASVAEYMMGHKVDPLEYNKAHRDEAWTRKEYDKALPMLQIMSSGRPFGLVEEEEVDILKQEIMEVRATQAGITDWRQEILTYARLRGMPKETLKKLEERLYNVVNREAGEEVLHNLEEEKMTEENNIKVAKSEGELIELIDIGWDPFREIPGGRFLLRKPHP